MSKLVRGIVAIVFIGLSATATAQQGDDRILAAREALRTGDRITLERLAAASEPGHVLDHYVPYWLLLNRLARPDPPPTAELAAYVSAHRGSVAADRLQAAWLRRLARDSDWQRFNSVFAEHQNPDGELRCLSLQARFFAGDRQVFDDIAAQWQDLLDAHEACTSMLQSAAATGHVSEDAVWRRIRRQVDSRSPDRAHVTASWLRQDQRPDHLAMEQAIGSPAQFLDRMPPNFAVTRAGRELAIIALTRLAREDAAAAYVRFTRINDRMDHDERAYVFTLLGHHGALSRLPQSDEWYRAAGDVQMNPAQRAWRVRAAIRSTNWRDVQSAIEALPEGERLQPEWVYWLARASAEQGRDQDAQALYRSISHETHFYGLLAAEELGQAFPPPPPDRAIAREDRARAATDPGIKVALTFYRLALNTEGAREWFRAVRDRDQAFLLAAAQLALEHELYDRAINTAELADPNGSFRLRFIAPYRDLVEPQVRQQGLDLAWVYGLMRQESRFIIPARSSAGAQGLMQVMPATGKWVAGRIGMRGYSRRMLNDPNTNVLLGTSYMRLILGDLDNHPVLASAGYNAGPGRARRWRDDRPLDATIYIETIPFDETRDYVKKVLANAVAYAAIFENRPQSLKARLGVIAPAPDRSDPNIQ